MSYDTPPQYPTHYVPVTAKFMFVEEGEHTADEAGAILMGYFWEVKISDLHTDDDRTYFNAELEVEVECYEHDIVLNVEHELYHFRGDSKLLEIQDYQIHDTYE